MRLRLSPTFSSWGLIGFFWFSGACIAEDRGSIRVEFLDASLSNPLRRAGTLRVELRQGEEEPALLEQELALDRSLRLSLRNSRDFVELATELTGPEARLLGRTPRFLPGESGGTLRIPLLPAQACTAMDSSGDEENALRLQEAVSSPAVFQVGTFAWILGGASPSGASSQSAFLDLLRYGVGEVAPSSALSPSSALGPSRAARVDERRALVVAEEGPTFLFDGTQVSSSPNATGLHEGAIRASALTSIPRAGIVVVGGVTPEGDASAEISLVPPLGDLISGELLAPRRHPAVLASGSNGVWVAGGVDGDSVEAPFLERWLVETRSSTAFAVDIDDGTRLNGQMVGYTSEEGSTDLWLLGGTDINGRPRTGTWLLRGCPDVCRASEGPSVSLPRDASFLRDGEDLLVIGGLTEDGTPIDLIRRFSLAGGEPSEELMPSLQTARASAGALRLGENQVLILGGRDEVGIRDDFEVCWLGDEARL